MQMIRHHSSTELRCQVLVKQRGRLRWRRGRAPEPTATPSFSRRERIVGNAPATPSDAEAAALPFDHHHCLGAAVRSIWRHARDPRHAADRGGVGSILIQLACQLTGLAVVVDRIAGKL